MRRSRFERWLGAALLGLPLCTGCTHSGQTASTAPMPGGMVAQGQTKPAQNQVVAGNPTPTAVPVGTRPAIPDATSQVAGPVAGTQVMVQGSLPPAQQPRSVLVQRQVGPNNTLSYVAVSQNQGPSLPPPRKPDPAISQVSHQEEGPEFPTVKQQETAPAVVHAEHLPSGKLVLDLTARPGLGHSPDYSWLKGEVEYSRLGGGWRLRYASLDEAESHGGEVTLTGDSRLRSLKDGELIQVQGHFAATDDEGAAPPYHVDSYTVIENPH